VADGLIPQSIIDEVRARSDLVDIVGDSVSLKKSGREFKACCPFHDEKTASFYVVPDKGFYKCFGCGKSGSVFDFVMEHLGMDFVEAVEHVAGRVGVEVRREHRVRPEDDPDRPYYEIAAFAQSWFREQLIAEDVGATARSYLENRGIDAATAERFGIGYAPDEWRAFREAALVHGFDEEVMLVSGLLKKSEKSKEPYDGFRGRVMFPIESLGGKVIGFGGRILEGDAPKYINSPETPIYEKGKNLYGLSWAKNTIRLEKCALVVEGYMDAVSLAAAGFENVVAQLGTALTEAQAVRLTRYTTRVVLLFDSDKAGLKATFKNGDILLEAGLRPAVVSLPDGEDPDTYVRANGAVAMAQMIGDAIDVFDRKIQILQAGNYFASIERKRMAVDKLLPTLRAATDPSLRDMYVARAAEMTGVRRETLEAEMERERPNHGHRAGQSTRTEPGNRGASRPAPSALRSLRPAIKNMGAEPQLLKVMVRGVEWVERAAEVISPEDFEDSYHRAIFEVLLEDPEVRAPPATMDSVAAQRFEEILADPEELSHGLNIFTESVNRIRVLALDRRVQDLQRRIEAAAGEDEKLELMSNKTKLAAELRTLDPNYWASAMRRDPVNRTPNESSR
jgi:DNA primase